MTTLPANGSMSEAPCLSVLVLLDGIITDSLYPAYCMVVLLKVGG